MHGNTNLGHVNLADLFYRFGVVLLSKYILNTNFKAHADILLDEEAFRLYGRQTAELWVSQCGK